MYKIIPLFATPICLFDLEIDNEKQNIIEDLLKNIKYIKTEDADAHISENLYLFKKYPELKIIEQKITKSILLFNEQVMKNKKINFKVTTSWASKCLKNQESISHKHCNSMYSAVYYNKINKQSSDIVFYNNNWNGHNYELDVTSYNEYNSSKWSVTPRDKLLIIFPSFLYHKIAKNFSKSPRYSIACNSIPIPPYGVGDNFIK
jgi:uncharacterized protein (TIGR02466 family)